MRFSAISAICAAPLVLAGSLEAEVLGRRGNHMEVGSNKNVVSVKEQSKNNNEKITIVQQTNQDVVIIWVNGGGGAATSTVTETKTVTAAAGTGGAVAGAVATHTVGFSFFPIRSELY